MALREEIAQRAEALKSASNEADRAMEARFHHLHSSDGVLVERLNARLRLALDRETRARARLYRAEAALFLEQNRKEI